MVLRAIVDDYIGTAEPVGSRTVARKYVTGISPATIRNEMADLEDQGYLEQPHTSAGRIPSNKGYRYYVDHLLEGSHVVDECRALVNDALSRQVRGVTDLIQRSARLLSEVTNCLTLASGPEVGCAILAAIQFLPLRCDRVMMVLVTDTGALNSLAIDLDEPLPQEDLMVASRLMTREMAGIPLEVLPSFVKGLGDGIMGPLAPQRWLIAEALREIHAESDKRDQSEVFMGGTTNLLKHPEFRDVEKVLGLLGALEHQYLAHQLLYGSTPGDYHEQVVVAIGEEMKAAVVNDCSLVMACYRRGMRTAGRIGVLGPRRMDYAYVMAVVEEVSRGVTRILSDA